MITRLTSVRKNVAHELDFLILLVGSTGLPKNLKEVITGRLMHIFMETERLSAPPSEAERLEIEAMFVPMGGPQALGAVASTEMWGEIYDRLAQLIQAARVQEEIQ